MLQTVTRATTVRVRSEAGPPAGVADVSSCGGGDVGGVASTPEAPL